MSDALSIDLRALSRVASCAVVGISSSGVRRALPVGTAAFDTPFRIASLTKPVTAVATVLAARRVGVELDTPVVEVVPDLRDDWAADERLTVAEVLSQTSGLASTVAADDVARLGDSESAITDAARLVVRAGSARPPGEVWEYYNGNYFLAGAITATLTGTSFEEALAESVLRPWGLSSTTFEAPPDLAPGLDYGQLLAITPYPRGRRPSGGLCSTAEDLLTLGEQLLADPELLGQLQTVRPHSGDPMRYALGWAIVPSGQMYLNGRLPGYRAAFMLVPDHDLVGVSLAATSDALAAQAAILSRLQQELTGDDLAAAIDAFAA
jgi:D-alanyl-D-alanine carboxypeptidase